MDVNDNPPVFEKREIKVTIAEDSAVNSIITTVIAQDADEGRNGAISYQVLVLSRTDTARVSNLTRAVCCATDFSSKCQICLLKICSSCPALIQMKPVIFSSTLMMEPFVLENPSIAKPRHATSLKSKLGIMEHLLSTPRLQ